MVRIALVLAFAATAQASRSAAEIDAEIAEKNFKITDVNFDYEAADALDFDEELSAGDFKFEESVDADAEQMFPCPTGRVKAGFNRGCATVLSDNGRGRCQLRFDDGHTDEMHAMHLEHHASCPQVQVHNPSFGSYSLGAPGSNQCPGGMTVDQAQCLSVVQSLLPRGQRQGRRNLVAGSWRHVPPGCSMQAGRTHGQRGDFAAHYNRDRHGRNDGGYTPICTGGGGGFQGGGGGGGFQGGPGFNGGGVMVQPGNFLVADGCRRSQGAQEPQIRNALGGFASVRCCSNNGRRCESTSIGCLQHQTMAQATAACSRRNMRLCSVQELDSGVCCGTGCGFDGHHIWTMTPAGGGGFVGQNGHGINININGGGISGQFGGQHGFSGSTFNGGGLHNQIANFVVADGCSSRSGRQQSRTQNGMSGRASVRCCSMDARRCETQTVGCLEGVSFNQANAACSSRGLRLCAQHELETGICCGSGCGFDGRRVWTSTPAR